jgi:ribonuclease G
MEHPTLWQAQQRLGEVWLGAYKAGMLTRLRILREGDGAQAGDHLAGVITSRLSPRQYLLTTAAGEDIVVEANLPKAANQRLHEGTRCLVHVTRAAIAEPGLIKRAQGIVAELLSNSHPQAAPITSTRVAQNVTWVAQLPQADGVIEDVLQGSYALPGGALYFERTRLGLVVDVDGYAAGDKLNAEAAQALARLLTLWDISGNVLIDFVQSAGKSQRTALGTLLDSALSTSTTLWQRNGPNGYGLVHLVSPRRHPSLLDQLFGTNRSTPSLLTQALNLLNAAAQSQGMGARTLWARAAIIRLMEENSQWIQSLSQKLGVPILLGVNPDPSAGTYVQVAHP